ncbi:hypothetical protein GCM10011361_22970 [Muriicola marianensis]|uniref:YdhG-like domain-containing protein n=2 Tax=Muriicola marianensis TaxID=1324801 RepID=A0ABQ1R4B6_9FLAO|nr:hypothetical protein GCM10011361_22970 [Muriicola marianensis]
MLLHLQTVVEQAIPEAEMKYKWRIPFFYLEGKPFCYLNRSKDYVDIGFFKAAYLTVHTEHMVTEGRKVMKSLRYRSLEAIDDQVLTDVLKDAYSVRDRKFYN